MWWWDCQKRKSWHRNNRGHREKKRSMINLPVRTGAPWRKIVGNQQCRNLKTSSMWWLHQEHHQKQVRQRQKSSQLCWVLTYLSYYLYVSCSQNSENRQNSKNSNNLKGTEFTQSTLTESIFTLWVSKVLLGKVTHRLAQKYKKWVYTFVIFFPNATRSLLAYLLITCLILSRWENQQWNETGIFYLGNDNLHSGVETEGKLIKTGSTWFILQKMNIKRFDCCP